MRACLSIPALALLVACADPHAHRDSSPAHNDALDVRTAQTWTDLDSPTDSLFPHDLVPDLPAGELALDEGGSEPEDVADALPDVADAAPESTDGESADADASTESDLFPELFEEVVDCPEGAPCDDDDPCTVNDVCHGDGGCSGSPMDCTDDDPCTTEEACVEGECVTGPDLCGCHEDGDCAPLNDGDPCTGSLVCDTGTFPWQCVVDPASVPDCAALDAPPCKAWQCDSLEGGCLLSNLPDGLPCDDGDPCSADDLCAAGKCQGEPVPACGIGAPCAGDEDCHGDLFCLETLPGGYCTSDNCQNGGCPPGAACEKPLADLPPLCLAACTGNQECRVADGYQCHDYGYCWCDEAICTPGETICAGDQLCLCNGCGSGCGEVLQDCVADGLVCEAGECVACQPDCTGKECGDDGCGGSCGLCLGITTCDEAGGQCICPCPPEANPVCDGATGTTYDGPCQAACFGILEPLPGTCGNCADLCLQEELESGPVCGMDGQEYPSFCLLKCAIGSPQCSLAACPELASLGPCLDVCVTTAEEPAEVGEEIPPFLCVNRNLSSPSLGMPVSSVLLKETVWIAYFGACS